MKKLIGKFALKMFGGLDGIVEMLGGVSSLIEWAIEWFNEHVLQKIKDKEEFAAYAEDVEQFGFFLDGVFTRHQKWMSEEKRDALVATINAVRELAVALKDAEVSKEEVDAIVDKIVEAVEAWKKAK